MLNKFTVTAIFFLISGVPIQGHCYLFQSDFYRLQDNFFQKHKTEIPLTDGIIKAEEDLPPFSGVAVHGPFDVSVSFIPQQYYIAYQGNGGLVGNVHYYVKNDILHVFTNQEFAYTPNYRVTLNIEVPCLKKFSYRGPGKVMMDNMNADHFILNVEESGYVYLCGKATRFDATLSGNSRLNAKCLFARTTFVNTVDFAQAEVASNGSVSALAADFSDIYYLENPKLVADYENNSGSVMRLQGLVEARPALQAPLPPVMQPANEGAVMMPDYGK